MTDNLNNVTGAPSYFDFAAFAIDTVYDIRALVDAARCLLDTYENATSDDELVDLGRLLGMAISQLSGLAFKIDEKTYAYTLKSPVPNVAHLQPCANDSVRK